MAEQSKLESVLWQINHSLARIILFSFLLTFILARVVVFLIMSHRLPDLYLHLGGTHIHHLNYGIFLLSGVRAYLLLGRLEDHRSKALPDRITFSALR